MPKLNTYPDNPNPTGAEKVVGFDPNNADQTELYNLQDIADLANVAGGGIVQGFEIVNNVNPTSNWNSSSSQASGSSGSEYSGLAVTLNNISGTKSKWAIVKAQTLFKGWTLSGGLKMGFVDSSNGDEILFIGHDSHSSGDFALSTNNPWMSYSFTHFMEVPAGQIMTPRVKHIARSADMLFFPARVQALVINLE